MATAPPGVMRAAMEAARLEASVDAPIDRVLASAVQAALRAAESHLIDRVAQAAEEYAAELPQDGDENTPAQQMALRWFAQKLLDDMPAASEPDSYDPQDGDLVQVVITGEVCAEEKPCRACNGCADVTWTVITESGDEYTFDLRERDNLDVYRITTSRAAGEAADAE